VLWHLALLAHKSLFGRIAIAIVQYVICRSDESSPKSAQQCDDTHIPCHTKTKKSEEISMRRLFKTIWQLGRVPLLAVALLMTQPAFADGLNGFELDRNAVDSGAEPDDDWDTDPDDANGEAFEYTGIVPDPVPESSIFTTGKSKDDIDVSEWKWKEASNILDKNNITNAYAAAYNEAGQLVIYFGLDRFSNDGSAQVGFWFFKGEVSLNDDGTFEGSHQNGDVLIQSNFSKGGVISTVTAYQWMNGSLVQLAAGGDCIGASATDPVCATVNQQPTNAPWTYSPKPNIGVPGTFPQGTFFEGGINLSQLGLTDACFSTFMAETRSSTPFDAVLKDFVGPREFETCKVAVTKVCENPRLNAAQDKIIYDIKGKVSAQSFGGSVFDVSLSDNPIADGSFNVVDCVTGDDSGSDFPLSSLSGDACYTNTITVPLDQNGTSDTVTVKAYTQANQSGSLLTDSAKATCPNLQISPAIKVTKDCSTAVAVDNGKVVAKVNISGKVCNIGDTILSNVTVVELNITTTPDPLVSNVSLSAPADPTNPTVAEGACKTYTGSYFPSAALDKDGNATTCPSDVVFKDTVKATATNIFGKAIQPQTDMADCKLCPDGGCPTPQ
jgi:hypothetical protein